MPEHIENRMMIESEFDRVINPTHFQCVDCGGFINEGEDYYDFGGDIVCQDCVKNYVDSFRRTADWT